MFCLTLITIWSLLGSLTTHIYLNIHYQLLLATLANLQISRMRVILSSAQGHGLLIKQSNWLSAIELSQLYKHSGLRQVLVSVSYLALLCTHISSLCPSIHSVPSILHGSCRTNIVEYQINVLAVSRDREYLILQLREPCVLSSTATLVVRIHFFQSRVLI